MFPFLTRYALVNGRVLVATAFAGPPPGARRGRPIVEGALGVLTGVITFAAPGVTALGLLWLIAGWALATGVMTIAAATRLHGQADGVWLLAVNGVLTVMFALLLASRPVIGGLVMVSVLGGYATAIGVLLIWLDWRLRRAARVASNEPRHSALL